MEKYCKMEKEFVEEDRIYEASNKWFNQTVVEDLEKKIKKLDENKNVM